MDEENFYSAKAPTDFAFVHQPVVAGAWIIGGPLGLRFYVTKRPGWFARRMSRWLLEWEWEDAPVKPRNGHG